MKKCSLFLVLLSFCFLISTALFATSSEEENLTEGHVHSIHKSLKKLKIQDENNNIGPGNETTTCRDEQKDISLTDNKVEKKYKMLVVDDSPMARKIAARCLQKKFQNYKILEAEDGCVALNLLKSEGLVDLILMDIQMPKMNGLDATREIRGKCGTTIPIIAVTSYTPKSPEEFSDAGMDSYIQKPLTPKKLSDTLKTLKLNF